MYFTPKSNIYAHSRDRTFASTPMLAAVVCFVSVLCTTTLASFGLEAATLIHASAAQYQSSDAFTGADEDVARLSDDGARVVIGGGGGGEGGGCFMFHELFAAMAVLVCILYYAMVKATLMAMGAVVMSPPRPHPLYYGESDDEADEEMMKDGDGGQDKGECVNKRGERSHQLEDLDQGNTEAAECESNRNGEISADGNEIELCEMPSEMKLLEGEDTIAVHVAPSGSEESDDGGASSGGDETSGSEVHVQKSPGVLGRGGLMMGGSGNSVGGRKNGAIQSERFNGVKIWTNIYGLSIGIYCLVYSLLLPSELSAFVFCVATLVAGMHEAATPCLVHYLGNEDATHSLHALNKNTWRPGEWERRMMAKKNRRCTSWQLKRCLGWICLFQSTLAGEIGDAAASASTGRGRQQGSRMRARKMGTKNKFGLMRSGVLAMPCLILLVVLGITCKVCVFV